jgi:hypothetical protein
MPSYTLPRSFAIKPTTSAVLSALMWVSEMALREIAVARAALTLMPELIQMYPIRCRHNPA